MAAKVPKPYIQRLECAVCLDTFRDPRTLPCGKGRHNVCKDCLQQLVRESSITCPLCRMVHTVPADGVDGFPPNLILEDMIDTLCKSCRKDEPDSQCTHCEQDVCISCKVSHMSFQEATQCLKEITLTMHEGEQKGNSGTIQLANALYKKIDEAAAILFNKLQERTKELKEEVRKMLEDKSGPLKKWKVEMDKQIVAAQKYLDDTKSKLGDKYNDNITDQELTDIKTWCQEKITEMKSSIQQAPSVPIPILEYDTTAVLSAIEGFGSINGSGISTDMKRITYGKPRVVGQQGTKPGEFSSPYGVAVCPVSGHMVLADPGNKRVQVFDADMKHLKDITKGRQGEELKFPFDVAVSSTGDIIITDLNANAVYVYSSDCVYSRQLPGPWSQPRSITIDGDDNVYICDGGTFSIKVMNITGKLIRSFGSKGSGQGQFSSQPWSITIYKSHVYVSDYGGRVYQFTTSGDYTRQLDQNIIANASGLSIRGTDDLVIVDQRDSIIIMRDDQLLCRVGECGDQPWQIYGPEGVAITKMGQIIVVNRGHNNILVYDPLE